MTETPTSIFKGPDRKTRRKEAKEVSGLVKGLEAALTVTRAMQPEPVASAESTVSQKLFFPKFSDGGPHLGKLYTKTWQAPMVMGVTDEWRNRVGGYWERLEIKYGVIWSRPFIDYDEETGCIITGATPLALVPGERYELQG